MRQNTFIKKIIAETNEEEREALAKELMELIKSSDTDKRKDADEIGKKCIELLGDDNFYVNATIFVKALILEYAKSNDETVQRFVSNLIAISAGSKKKSARIFSEGILNEFAESQDENVLKVAKMAISFCIERTDNDASARAVAREVIKLYAKSNNEKIRSIAADAIIFYAEEVEGLNVQEEVKKIILTSIKSKSQNVREVAAEAIFGCSNSINQNAKSVAEALIMKGIRLGRAGNISAILCVKKAFEMCAFSGGENAQKFVTDFITKFAASNSESAGIFAEELIVDYAESGNKNAEAVVVAAIPRCANLKSQNAKRVFETIIARVKESKHKTATAIFRKALQQCGDQFKFSTEIMSAARLLHKVCRSPRFGEKQAGKKRENRLPFFVMRQSKTPKNPLRRSKDIVGISKDGSPVLADRDIVYKKI